VKLALQIAAGILIASAVIFVGRLLFVAAAAKAVTAEVEAMQTQMVRRAEERSRELSARAAARREAERLQAEQLARDRVAQAQLRIERERREADAERRKATAWSAFYRPAKDCEDPPTWEIQVECGNRYIRAKREFEAQWAAQEAAAAAQAMIVRGDGGAGEPIPR